MADEGRMTNDEKLTCPDRSPGPRAGRIRHWAFVIRASVLLPFSTLLAEPANPPPIRPPFGLTWDEPELELEQSLLGGSGRIVERKKTRGEGESWYVEGFRQPALQRATFHLRHRRLAGVELQYGKEDWTAEAYEQFMESVRQGLEAKFGAGALIARKQDTERGLLQTLLGYRWEQPSGSIELVYFAAQNPENLYRAVSLHYSAPIAAAPEVAPPPPAVAPTSSAPPLPPLPEK
jgi:hypothetical protein